MSAQDAPSGETDDEQAAAVNPEDVVVFLSSDNTRGIPFDVTASLVQAVGAMYPGTTMGAGQQTFGRVDGFSLRIPAADRRAGPATPPGSVARTEPDPADPSCGVTGFDGATLSCSTPPQASQQLASWAHTLLADNEAVNYVEQAAYLPDGRRLVVTACWSETQTPHELRVAAEQRAEQAETQLRTLLSQPDSHDDGTEPELPNRKLRSRSGHRSQDAQTRPNQPRGVV